jgi:hypothetical protein
VTPGLHVVLPCPKQSSNPLVAVARTRTSQPDLRRRCRLRWILLPEAGKNGSVWVRCGNGRLRGAPYQGKREEPDVVAAAEGEPIGGGGGGGGGIAIIGEGEGKGHRKLAATWLSQPATPYSSSSISSDGVLPPARSSRGGVGALARSWLAKEASTMLLATPCVPRSTAVAAPPPTAVLPRPNLKPPWSRSTPGWKCGTSALIMPPPP